MFPLPTGIACFYMHIFSSYRCHRTASGKDVSIVAAAVVAVGIVTVAAAAASVISNASGIATGVMATSVTVRAVMSGGFAAVAVAVAVAADGMPPLVVYLHLWQQIVLFLWQLRHQRHLCL